MPAFQKNLAGLDLRQHPVSNPIENIWHLINEKNGKVYVEESAEIFRVVAKTKVGSCRVLKERNLDIKEAKTVKLSTVIFSIGDVNFVRFGCGVNLCNALI